MTTDEMWSDLMHRAVEDVETDVARIVSQAVVRGEAKRQRRRWTQGGLALAGVAAATALIAGVGPVLLGAGTSGEKTPAASGPSTSAGQQGETTATPRHGFGVPPDEMATTLASLLPAGTTTELTNWPKPVENNGGVADLGDLPDAAQGGGSGQTAGLSNPLHLLPMDSGAGGFQAGSVVFDDGQGPAMVEISISLEPGTPAQWSDDCAGAAEDRECQTLADGSVLVTYSGPHGEPGVIGNYVILHSADGFGISAAAINAPTDEGVAPTRSDPPLTLDQLAEITKNPVWAG